MLSVLPLLTLPLALTVVPIADRRHADTGFAYSTTNRSCGSRPCLAGFHFGPRRLAHAWLSSAIWSYSRQRVAKHRATTAGLLVTSCKFFENEGERTAGRKVRHTPLFSDSIACPRHKSAPPESRARPSKGFPGKPAVFTIPSNLSHQ